MPFPIIPALTAAAPVIASGISALAAGRQARTARKNVQRTNQARMELAKFQFSKNKEMWELMKEYNTPSEQMSRFKEAGLNPNLIYGQGTPGNVQQYPQYQAPNIDYTGQPNIGAAGLQAGLQGLYQGVSNLQEIQMKREQIEQAEIKTWLDDETAINLRNLSTHKSAKAFYEANTAQVENARQKVQHKIDQIKASFWEDGVSPSDATWIRVGLNALETLGLDVTSIWNQMPDQMRNRIQNN